MLLCDHYLPPDRYNPIVEVHLREIGFYHVSQIGVVQCQSAMVNALIERWRPETHTFHFLIGECAVSLEDVAMILGLPTNGVPVTGPTMSSFEAIEAECLHQFGVAPRNRDCRGSFIKLTWFRDLKDRTVLTDDIQIQRYVKCHIMLLFGTILFGDKSGAAVHWKFLPLLRNFAGIIQYSWGSACLAHLNRSLCRATRVNCKEIDGPLTLLLTWAWIRLPFLAPIPGNPRVFPIANRWRNWNRENFAYRYHTLAHYRRLLDDLQEGHAYGIDFIEPDVVPLDIRQHSVVWSATVPLISFECIEWHSSDRFKRQFGLIQDVPTQERDLGTSHGEVLTGPKNQDWSNTHSFWIMQWTNRYSHVLADDLVPLHYPLEIYMHWYRGAFGAHLQISDLVFQEDPEGPPSVPLHQEYWSGPQADAGEQASFSQLLGFMAPGPGMSFDSMPRVHTSSENSGARMSVDSSRSADATRGILQSGLDRRISMTLIQETNNAVDNDTDKYLVDNLDSDEDEDEDEDEDDDEDEDEDHGDDPEPSTGTATSEKGKGYNLRTDPPRRSATRYTPSAFNRVAKKCKKLFKDVKSAMKK
ncbi:uncharacterized protein DS421_8g246540 [Arachis hypogaea]|nr:uncharacterized protein DS421_8g246540 [Arachis hypogaea]